MYFLFRTEINQLMNATKEKNSKELAEHFFRNEYGKLVSVITRYIGIDNVETAEDIVQETLLKAVDNWQHNGIPKNPQAWLYTIAKNLTLNILKKKKHQKKYENEIEVNTVELEKSEISEVTIADEQLKMMFVCCHPAISEKSQIALILKILCGFSITEIANAFFSTNETINKRLVRGRKQLKQNNLSFQIPQDFGTHLPIVQKTIYLLFNEGYSPTQKNELIRFDLCLEAIRLTEILIQSKSIVEKNNCYSLLALMYLNASRFEARISNDNSIVEMEHQDRGKWDNSLINQGIRYLNEATKENNLSMYLILATISANYCIAKSFEDTDWNEILSLYDDLLEFEDSPTIRLNRGIVLAQVKGNEAAIKELKDIEKNSDIGNHHLFHATMAEFYKKENNVNQAVKHLNTAIQLTTNKRDINLLKKRLSLIVPK